jgi:hypothetical protein
LKFATDPEDVAVVQKYLSQLESDQAKQRHHWPVVAGRSSLAGQLFDSWSENRSSS